jgi:hypothetical protein
MTAPRAHRTHACAALAAVVAMGCAGATQSTAPLTPAVTLAESPSRGTRFTFCAAPESAPVQLTNAVWLSFLSANEYTHAIALAPLLNALGFYNPARPEDREWPSCLGDLRELRRVESPRDADSSRATGDDGRGDAALRLLPSDGSWGACARRILSGASFRAREMPSSVLQERLVHTVEKGAYLQFFSGRKGSGRWFTDASTQLVFARHKDLPVVIIAFRGTEPGQVADVVADLETWKTRLAGHGWPEAWGSVHAGFQAAFAEVEPLLLRKLDELSGTGVGIWVTGHSLGAALATLTMARILRAVDEGADLHPAGLYTYGSPRVGDREFAAALTSRAAARGVPLVRVRNDDDAVTAIPPAALGYVHVGTLVHLSEDGLGVAPALDPPYKSLSLADHSATGVRNGRPASGYYRRLEAARDSGRYADLDRCGVAGTFKSP